VHAKKAVLRRRLAGIVFWAVFFAGLLVQFSAPRLKIENRAFVIPAPQATDSPVSVAELVTREKRMQMLSAALTVMGALGLAYHYRWMLGKAAPN